MSRKRIIALLIAIVIIGGAAWGIKVYFDVQAHNAYLASPDRKADQLLADLTTGNYQDAYNNLYSARMKANYSLDYWKNTDQIYPQLKGYKGSPKLVSKQLANDANPSQPKPYSDDVSAEQYAYDFSLNNLTYRVTFVVLMFQGSWQVSELEGAYQK